MSAPPGLSNLLEELLRDVQSIPPLAGLTTDRSGGDLRENLLLTLRVKLLPELRSREPLPVFVAVQGGTNVGKSTVFNALCGKLLSPSIVQASATKHPLVFVHERWRETLLTDHVFPGLVCKELEDPKELIVDGERTELLYLRFHRDESLAAIAIIDSPDFDSVLETNLEVARTLTVLSDVTVFVTTQQKYRDRTLVEWIRHLAELKALIVVAFNLVGEDIVFETLLDDLRQLVEIRDDDLVALRIPPSTSSHPEEEIRELLEARVLDRLRSLDAAEVKPVILRRTLQRLVEQTTDLTARFSAERATADSILEFANASATQAANTYDEEFDLALPEETLAIRQAIRVTELSPWIGLPEDVKKASKILGLISQAIGGFNDTARRILMRLSRRDEGAIGDEVSAIEEYASARNDADFERIHRRAESAQLEVETFLRQREGGSALARELLSSRFDTGTRAGFANSLRTDFDERVNASVDESGEHVYRDVNAWVEGHPLARKIATTCCVALKASAGIMLARVLPPDQFLHLLNWVWFAVGYFAAAYVIALVVSLSLRRKRRFRRTRLRITTEALQRSIVAPLESETQRVLRDDLIARISERTDTLARHPDVRGEAIVPVTDEPTESTAAGA